MFFDFLKFTIFRTCQHWQLLQLLPLPPLYIQPSDYCPSLVNFGISANLVILSIISPPIQSTKLEFLLYYSNTFTSQSQLTSSKSCSNTYLIVFSSDSLSLKQIRTFTFCVTSNSFSHLYSNSITKSAFHHLSISHSTNRIFK